MNTPQDDTPIPSSGTKKYRLFFVLFVFLSVLLIAHIFHLEQYFQHERIRMVMESAGFPGFLAFVGLFSIGIFLQIPGWIFVAAAMLAYDRALGFIAALSGGVVAVTLSFIIVRTIGGKAFAEIDKPFIQRLLKKLDEHPILTVAFLRLLIWMAPPLNYALAMTRIRLDQYIIGSLLGLAPSIAVLAVFFDWFFARFL